jgi:preprotein translocase subunit YajC
LTVGGFYGVVKGFKNDDKVLILELDKNVKVELLKSSIAQNMSAEERNASARKK